MRAATIVNGTLVVREHPDPKPGLGQILVRVRASGVNGADPIQVAGAYPAPKGSPPDIPGLELAGEVVAIGPDVFRWSVGDKVMAIVGGGSHAELCLLHEREAMPIPESLDMVHAGGLPEVFMTAHDALFSQIGLTMGERLCVHGAAGGVGTAAVQLGVGAGARVVATVRKPEMRSKVSALGAVAIDPGETKAHGPYDAILELVGAPNWDTNVSSIAEDGRISIIGVGGGAETQVNLMKLMAKRVTVRASTLRARSLERKAEAARRLEKQVLPLVGSGKIKVPVEETFPLAEAPAAYERFKAGGKFGKVIICP